MSALVEHENAALTLPGDIGETALTLPPGLSYDEWQSVGSRLQGADDSLKWWIGDWLTYGERKYGETYAAAIEKTGYGVERLRKYKWVAEKVRPENRYSGTGFSWSKHRAVASLDPLAQPKVLEAAVEHGWSSEEITKRIRAAEAGNTRAFTPEWQPAGRLSAQTPADAKEQEEGTDDDRPIFDQGAAGEAMAAERGTGMERADTDGFDDIERIRRIWNKLTPDLHIRFLRTIMTADLFAQIAPDFQQEIPPSKSRVEPSPLAPAPREAPATATPAVSTPRAATVSGGALSGPGFDPDGEMSKPTICRSQYD